MTQVIEATKGKIRDLPIQKKLRDILLAAGEEVGIDIVRVTSGGQARLGSGGKRTGSTRHDDGAAADLQLEKGGKVLNFENSQERPIIAQFVTACAAKGATGIGAGVDYMGPHTLHIGFGSKAVWGGANASAAKAPAWLKEAVAAGFARPKAPTQKTLRFGDKGDDVLAVQKKLFALDGHFGATTEAAVKVFQKAHGLHPDGVVGGATLKELGL
jgi:hypothetical protein